MDKGDLVVGVVALILGGILLSDMGSKLLIGVTCIAVGSYYFQKYFGERE